MNSATVKDLKLAVKKKVNESEQSKMGHRHISWSQQTTFGIKVRKQESQSAPKRKHVWRNFCLSYQNEKLLDDNGVLQDYGIHNNSQVQFIPYVISRVSQRHSRRRKHRFFHGLSRRVTKRRRDHKKNVKHGTVRRKHKKKFERCGRHMLPFSAAEASNGPCSLKKHKSLHELGTQSRVEAAKGVPEKQRVLNNILVGGQWWRITRILHPIPVREHGLSRHLAAAGGYPGRRKIKKSNERE
ncbi:hypothetical protein RJ640_020780 [Escallonia rubra]|uniref:SNRNP25 ubiquitin-like domain-containing protein n=1 Tax=Escallonia rubra TaxID=112253 RepID=A0AA88U8H7_9ASTE|nr:hypothetical protein RJ640_020780 [Escallonia rubra]